MLAVDMRDFQERVWEFYRQHSRELPWREEPFEAYKILVSEVMLQQTQVPRVIPKYQEFLVKFPNPGALKITSLSEVIRAWSGLGYNRRAKYLHEAAKQLDGKSVWIFDDLVACKGIGPNTAAAVMTYAYNQAIPFIETNIRTVYIHEFFKDQDDVSDKEILPLVEATLDHEHPREWYWALMDYGSHLKATVGNASRSSKHYAKQSKFEGSNRQIRGNVLRLLATEASEKNKLEATINDARLHQVLDDLEREKLIVYDQNLYRLAD